MDTAPGIEPGNNGFAKREQRDTKVVVVNAVTVADKYVAFDVTSYRGAFRTAFTSAARASW